MCHSGFKLWLQFSRVTFCRLCRGRPGWFFDPPLSDPPSVSMTKAVASNRLTGQLFHLEGEPLLQEESSSPKASCCCGAPCPHPPISKCQYVSSALNPPCSCPHTICALWTESKCPNVLLLYYLQLGALSYCDFCVFTVFHSARTKVPLSFIVKKWPVLWVLDW